MLATEPRPPARSNQRGIRMQATSKTYSPIPSDGTSALEVLTARGAADLKELREEIDQLDAEILRLVRRRTEISRNIGAARMAAGGTRIVHSREMAVLARFGELGPEGRDLAMLLLRLGRGRLGRSDRCWASRSTSPPDG